jgi:type IX secretion system PorP/SprF family membrane protein
MKPLFALKQLLLLLITALITISTKAQNAPHYSLYMLQQSIINPAAIGSYGYVNGAALFKKQWIGIDKAPTTIVFDINAPLGKTNSALGLNVVNDKFGYTNSTQLTINYAYRLRLNYKNYIAFGLGAMANMYSANLSKIPTADANDPLLNGDVATQFTPNFKFGAYYFTDDFYFGLGMPNLLTNKYIASSINNYSASTGFDYNQLHFFAHSGWQKKITPALKLMPSVMVKQVAGAPLQLDVNLQVMLFSKLGIGASYRTLGTYIALLNVQASKQLNIAYSYNYHTGSIKPYTSGSHEIMLGFKFMNTTKKLIPVECPHF